MSDVSREPTGDDWLIKVWETLDARSRSMLAMRAKNRTLSSIGRAHGLTRERARQVISHGQTVLSKEATLARPDWAPQVRAAFEEVVAVSDEDLRPILQDDQSSARASLLLAMGLVHPRVWRREILDHWALQPDALNSALRKLAESAPYSSEELASRSIDLGIPGSISPESLMAEKESPLQLDRSGYWVRKSAKIRDAAYLWLAEQGKPERAGSIAEALGTNARALTEQLRRDPRFARLRAEGTWALAEWRVDGLSEHSNALDVMIEVLTQLGPMRRRDLSAEVKRRYPVSESRIQQCLLSDRIGRTTDGLVGLISQGARITEEKEPRKPANAEHDEETGLLVFLLKVNKDVIRGSGVLIHPWITWRMGLRRAPMERLFLLEGDGQDVMIRRMTSGAQISSLRRVVLNQGLALGCALAVTVRLEEGTVAIRHVCEPGACPLT